MCDGGSREHLTEAAPFSIQAISETIVRKREF